LLFAGEKETASADFDDLCGDNFRQVTRDMGYLYTLSRLAQAAIALGRRDKALELYALLQPYSGYNAINEMSLGLGSVAHYVGLLARFLERPAEAIVRLEEAVAMNARLGDKVHEAQALLALSELRHSGESNAKAATGEG
jgi:hypothetical protein